MHFVNDKSKYTNEYDVKILRLKDFFANTSESKKNMAGSLVEFLPGEKIREHINKENMEEIFLLMDGTADFVLDGKVYHMSAGDIGLAKVGESHYFINTSDSPSRMLCLLWDISKN